MILRGLSFRGLILLGLATPGVSIHGQMLHASGPLPSFEVATIRPWQPPPTPPPPADGTAPKRPARIDPGRPGGQTTDRVRMIGQVEILVQSAFNLPVGSESQIVGAPEWIRTESNRYDIQAKIEDSFFAAMQKMTQAQQREQVDLMEQSLLADRFKLKVHFETRDMPAYSLVVAKGGPKLTPAAEGEPSRLSSRDTGQGSELVGQAVTLDQFAHSPLLRKDGRIVIDQTGLKGPYDFTLKSEAGADAASFFTLIQEQLGLRMVPSKVQVEVIVIDHIEAPTEN